MQKGHMNGPTKVNYSKHDKTILSESTSSKSNNGTLNANPRKNKLQILDDDELDLAPYAPRKDRLIQELETSLAEMDDQLESASKLEGQKTATEDQRSSLLKEIEIAVSEIQGHVINAREMEIEKKAIENECNGLKKQVKHLRTLLDKQTPNDKQWHYVDLMDSQESMRISLAHANSRNRTLEKEVKKLRLANERLHLNGNTNKDSSDYEKLKCEFADLQKLLQVAETSEDNIAQELATCHQTMAQMKDDYEQLEKVKAIIEDERDSLALVKTKLEMENKKLRQDKQNCNIIEKESPDRSSLEQEKEVLQRKLQLNEDNCEKLDQENSTFKKRIEELQNELTILKQETSVKLESENKVENSNPTQHLKSALVKLNKENSKLQETLEKSEEEISELKSRLEKDQANRESEANADNTQLRPAFDKLNKENLQLQTELEKAEKEMSALKICLAEEREGKTPAVATPDLTPKKPEKTKKIKGLKLKSKKEKKEAASTANDVDCVNDELEGLKKTKFNLESECQALSETVTKIAGEKRTMKKQIEELTNEKIKLEAKIAELETLIKELEVVKGQKEELDQKHQETEACLAQVSADLEKTNENSTTLNNHLEKTLEEKEALLQEKKEFQTIQQEMENVRKDYSKKSTEIKLLRKKHEEEKRRLIGMKYGGDKETNRLKTELKEISRKVMKSTEEDSEHDSKDVVATIEKLHNDIDQLNQRNTELEQSKQELEKKLNEVSQKAEGLEKESAKASDMAMDKAVELSRTKRSLERKIEKLNKENAEYRRKMGVATPAMSITPRISPETVQVQNAQVVESQVPLPSSSRQPGAPPPPQRSEPHRLSGVRHEGPVKIGPPGAYSGALSTRPPGPPQEYQIRGQERSYGPGPPGSRSEEANTRNGHPERSPPPYPVSKRKSLDEVLNRDREGGNQRNAPPYPLRERRTSDFLRPQSGSIVTVTAGYTGEKDDARNREESSTQRERRRSDGGYTYRKRILNQAERYRPDSRSSDQNSAFRVAGHRKKVLHEDYV